MVDVSLILLFVIDLVAVFAAYLIVTVSLNLEFGYTGIPNFGKVLPFAAGAFAAGSFPGRLLAELSGLPRGIEAYASNEILATCVREFAFRKPQVLTYLNYVEDNVVVTTCLTKLLQSSPLLSISVLLLTLLVAAAVGATLGYVSSYPAIRLREDYLAMTLLAMAELVSVVGYNYPEIVGGTLGVSLPDPYAWVGGERRFLLATVALAVMALITFFYMERVSLSPFGRVMKAVRDGELASEALGKDVVRLRQKVLIIASALAGIGGALWAFYLGGVISTGYDRVTWTFWPWVMVIIGGAANNLGVVLGTGIFVTSRKLIDFYKFALEPYLPFSVVWVDRLALGILLIFMLIVRPEGILAEKPRMAMKKEKILSIMRRAKTKP